MCQETHDLEACEQYLEKTIEERRSFLTEKRLCYSCYSPTSRQHSARTCQARRKCSKCGRLHPTGLHGYNYKKQATPNIQSYATKIPSSISRCVVQVKLRNLNPNNEVYTYAMLDNCSQGTFITEGLLTNLKAGGNKTSITIKTLSGEKEVISKAITGLEVSEINSDEWIQLPKCFSQNELPVASEEIATPERVAKWKYLNRIKDELCTSDEIEVGILIGANCPKALEPIKVISSQDNGPYAVKSRLGWCIVGPLQNSSHQATHNCNKIWVNPVIPDALNFTLKESGKQKFLADGDSDGNLSRRTGHVRSAKIWCPQEKTSYHRPCNKMVVLIEASSNLADEGPETRGQQ